MTRKVALQMDPIASLKPTSDSTLALGMEAQKRGYELYYYTPEKLSYDGKVTAQGYAITLWPDAERHYELKEALTIDVASMDVVLLRQDPPFHMPYLTTTYLLEMLPATTLVVNDPASVRNHPEKLFPALLRQFTPETLITADPSEIERFYRAHKDIILKPLYGYGGHSVLRFKPGDDNFHAILEMHFSESKEPWVAQRFLADVKTGERRIVMIDGEVAGVFGRIPAEGEIRANMRVGGTPVKAELTKRQREMCEALGPMLREKGLLLAGVDMIGDYLIEVNITSPTGLRAIHNLYGTKPEAMLWDAIESRLSH